MTPARSVIPPSGGYWRSRLEIPIAWLLAMLITWTPILLIVYAVWPS